MFNVNTITKDSGIEVQSKNGIELAREFVNFVKKVQENPEYERNLMVINDIEIHPVKNELGCLVAKFFQAGKEIAGLDIQDEYVSTFEMLSIIGEA